PEDRQTVYTFLSPKEMADIFGGLKFNKQIDYVDEMDKDYASDMFNSMFTDDIVNFLSKLDRERSDALMQNLDKPKADKIKNLLSYEKETAGAVMTKELISISSAETVSDVLDMLRDKALDAEIVYYIYVLNEEGYLVVVVSIRDISNLKQNEIIEDVMSTKVVSDRDNKDQEHVGMLNKKDDFLAAPVVDSDDHLLGIVT